MKKTVRTFVLMLAMLLMIVHVSAAEAAQLSAEQVNVLAGKTIEYRISITGNPGLAAIKLQLEYDTDILTPVTVEESREIICQRGDFASKGAVSGAVTADGAQFMWYHSTDVDTDGTVLSFQFRVSETAKPGVYPVKVSCSPWNITDKDGNLKPMQCQNGEVEVHAYCPRLYTEPVKVAGGEEFDYAIKLMDNPGIAAMKFDLLFDKNKFEFVTDADGNAVYKLGEAFKAGSLQVKKYGNALRGFWYQSSNAVQDGVVLTVRLRVKETAEPGPAIIKIQYDAEQTLDQEEKPVVLQIESGSTAIVSDTKMTVTKVSDQSLQVKVTAPVGVTAVTAVYDSQGKLLEAFWNQITEKTMVLTNETGHSLKNCKCKVMLVNSRYAPLCPAEEKSF